MRFWTPALMAGLAASAAVDLGDSIRRRVGEDVPPDLKVKKDAMVVQELAEIFAPVTINVSAHLVASSSDRHLSDEAVHGQMDVINRSFAPHNISFALVSTDRIVSQYWASGLGELRMMWDSNRGDGRTLNLYFIERFVENATQSGLAYPPHRLTVDPGAYRIDSVIITASTVPGGPADRAAFKGMMAVRGIGVWLGLLNDLPGDCDDAAQVQSRLCHTEFTPDQARRMHENWNKYRAPHRVPTQALLAPMEPVEKKDKRAYYPDPVSKIAAMVECLPHEINVTRETRESYCGSFIYCYFGTWKAAGKGEKYNGPNPGQQCFEERAAPESFMVDVLDSARVPSTGVADKFSSLWASFEGGGYPF